MIVVRINLYAQSDVHHLYAIIQIGPQARTKHKTQIYILIILFVPTKYNILFDDLDFDWSNYCWIQMRNTDCGSRISKLIDSSTLSVIYINLNGWSYSIHIINFVRQSKYRLVSIESMHFSVESRTHVAHVLMQWMLLRWKKLRRRINHVENNNLRRQMAFIIANIWSFRLYSCLSTCQCTGVWRWRAGDENRVAAPQCSTSSSAGKFDWNDIFCKSTKATKLWASSIFQKLINSTKISPSPNEGIAHTYSQICFYKRCATVSHENVSQNWTEKAMTSAIGASHSSSHERMTHLVALIITTCIIYVWKSLESQNSKIPTATSAEHFTNAYSTVYAKTHRQRAEKALKWMERLVFGFCFMHGAHHKPVPYAFQVFHK